MSLTERAKKLRAKKICTPAICVERLMYMTESYMQTECEPEIIRRAKALDNILQNMSIRIDEGELFVGNFTSKDRAGAIIPEIKGQWVLDEKDTLSTRPFDRYQPLTEGEERILEKYLPYWKDKALHPRHMARLPEKALKANYKLTATAGFCENGHHWAHVAVDYKLLLQLGIEGVLADIERRRDALKLSEYGALDQYHFYDAAAISLRAVIAFAERYARLAETMAAEEKNPVRVSELHAIAETCRVAPRCPAHTFREALQGIWILYVCLSIEGWGAGMTVGRLDQLLYPYYALDKKEGRLTDEETQELISLMMIKMNEAVALQSYVVADGKGGHPIMQGITIGGVTPDGADAVNDLTYLILEAERDVGLSSEDLVVRINRKNPERYVMKALEVARDLHGKLKFVSDDTSIPSMLCLGATLEQARDYISTGCHNPTIPGVARTHGGGMLNYGLITELALNDGRSRLTGEQIGPHTGDPRTFKSFEDVMTAYKTQVSNALEIAFTFQHSDLEMMSHVPCPLQSAFFPSCVERALDVYNGGCAPHVIVQMPIAGAANVADSLAAIKKTVFDDKRLTMDRLIDALDHNYEGYEDVLHLVSQAPKFGNDDDYVDLILKDVVRFSCDYVKDRESFGGAHFGTTILTMTANVMFGRNVGALPDGRLAGQPLAEGGVSPYQGRNVSGTVATLNSVAKLDQTKLTNGSILNLRISAGSVATQEKLKKLATIVRTYCENGGNLVQFNFTSNTTLRAAQENPEQYRDLLVRVATYSAFFVELGKETQEDIIRRNEFADI
ncbi:MAG: glycyl radical protein [Anaerovoracaceae bacterium]